MNDQASNEGSTMKRSMTKAGAEVKETLREAKDTLKTGTKDVVSRAKNYSTEYLEKEKVRTADRIGTVCESVRQTADRFEREQDPNIARYTRLVADKLDRAATYVRERDLRELRHDGEHLARQYPALFFGGMFVAGFAAARFLRASASHEKVEDGPVDEKPADQPAPTQ
jgi:hypothetical protein